MKSRISRVLIVLLCLSLFTSCRPSVPDTDTDADTVTLPPETEGFPTEESEIDPSRLAVPDESAELAAGEDPDYMPDYTNVTCLVVAPDGDDENGRGTLAHPYATPDRARDAARLSSSERVVIYLRGGTDQRDSALTLNSEDSGDIYSAYRGEKVTVTAGETFSLEGAVHVTDEAILGALQNADLRDRIYAVNLRSLGYNGGFDLRNPCGMTVGGENLTVARYPDEGEYLTISEIGSEWPFMPIRVSDPEGRISGWQDRFNLDGYVCMGGYPGFDWAFSTCLVEIDYENNNLIENRTWPWPTYPAQAGQRVYFYNLLSELNLDTEYFFNSRTGDFYFLSEPGGVPAGTALTVIAYDGNLVEIEGDRVSICGISFSGSFSGSAVKGTGSSLLIKDCEFTDIHTGVATVLEGSENTVTGCYYHDIGGSCCEIRGGDTLTLTSGNNLVYNNRFRNWGNIMRTYSFAVDVTGDGALVSHNTMSEAPHLAISYSGCDLIFEYNEIYNVCNDSSDCGAIYSGRSYYNRGVLIRYNYFHDLKREGELSSGYVNAVYQDDCGSAFTVTGNIFADCDRAFLIGGGRDNVFSGNLLIGCGNAGKGVVAGELDDRGIVWNNNPAGFDAEADAAYREGVWAERFPEVGGLWEDGDRFFYPMNNTVSDNILLNCGRLNIAGTARRYGTVERNRETSDTALVADIASADYRPDTVRLRELVSDFPHIPLEHIGVIG